MLNLFLFPFRLLGWTLVQLTRAVGLLIVQPLRVLMAPLGLLSSRITLFIVFIAYGAFALRLSVPHPIGVWYTTIIHYPYPADVTAMQLVIDTLTFRETDHPTLRVAQWWIAFWTVIVFALFKITRDNHKRIRKQLAQKARQLIEMEPPRLWKTPPKPAGKVSRVAPPPAQMPAVPQAPAVKSSEPKKPRITVHACYGLRSRAMDESHATINDRLTPELRAFISQT